MTAVIAALARAIASQLHPRMLALLLVPVLAALLFWVVAALLLWQPMLETFRGWFFGGTGVAAGVGGWIVAWTRTLGLEGLAAALPALLALLLLLPLMFAIAMVVVAVVSMPAVLHHLSSRGYQDVARAGSGGYGLSVGNGLVSFAVFAVGYVVTIPLWLFPPFAVLVPWLWWSWLTARVMRIDSLVEHATPQERRAIVAARGRDYFWLALAITALNWVPPLFLLTPTLAALAFAHYSLAALRAIRHDAAPPPAGRCASPSPAPPPAAPALPGGSS